MQVFFYIIFVMVVGIAIFAVQNSDAPLVTIKFLIWSAETSLVYLTLGSLLLGILLMLLLWIPRSIRSAIRKKNSSREIH